MSGALVFSVILLNALFCLCIYLLPVCYLSLLCMMSWP